MAEPVKTMDILRIEPTRITPKVVLNDNGKKLLMSGRSSPENAIGFYSNIQKAVDQYFKNQQELTVFFHFEYFNTSSSKCLFQLLKQLNKYKELGHQLYVNWLYDQDDEDMMETGEDFADVIDMDINLIGVDDDRHYAHI